jgi:uncharacterized protein
MTFWKAYFTGDIHGSSSGFSKLIKAGKFYNVQAVIIAGDLVGKGMIPVIQEASKYTCEFGGEKRVLYSQGDLERMLGMIADAGFYSYVTNPDEVADLQAHPDQIEKLIDRLIMQRMEVWIEQMEASTRRDGIFYYISAGNDDPFCIDPLLDASTVVINAEEKCLPVHEKIDLLTCGWTNPTPWNTPRELPEDQFLEKLEGLVRLVPDPKKCIFSLHAPPYQTHLDVAPALTKDMRMQSGLTAVPFQNVGSRAVRTIIEKYQPLVAVHGHIHESAGKEKLGNTWCFNHGSEYAQGILKGIILTFNVDKQVKYANYLSVSG